MDACVRGDSIRLGPTMLQPIDLSMRTEPMAISPVSTTTNLPLSSQGACRIAAPAPRPGHDLHRSVIVADELGTQVFLDDGDNKNIVSPTSPSYTDSPAPAFHPRDLVLGSKPIPIPPNPRRERDRGYYNNKARHIKMDSRSRHSVDPNRGVHSVNSSCSSCSEEACANDLSDRSHTRGRNCQKGGKSKLLSDGFKLAMQQSVARGDALADTLAQVREEKVEKVDPPFALPPVDDYFECSSLRTYSNYLAKALTGNDEDSEYWDHVRGFLDKTVNFIFGSYKIIGPVSDADHEYRPPSQLAAELVNKTPNLYEVHNYHFGLERKMIVSATLFNYLAMQYHSTANFSISSLLLRVRLMWGIRNGEVCTIKMNHMSVVYDTCEYLAAWHKRNVEPNFQKGGYLLAGAIPCALDLDTGSENDGSEASGL